MLHVKFIGFLKIFMTTARETNKTGCNRFDFVSLPCTTSNWNICGPSKFKIFCVANLTRLCDAHDFNAKSEFSIIRFLFTILFLIGSISVFIFSFYFRFHFHLLFQIGCNRYKLLNRMT